MYRGTIGAEGQGTRLLDHLVARYRHSSEAEWEGRIAAGRVRVDGGVTGPDAILRQGQILTWERPPWREPEVPLHYAVLRIGEDFLAVAKPSGLPTLPGGGFLDHTLLSLVRRRYPDASPVHRLGRGTSGIVLFARTDEAAKGSSKAWREHRVTKVYRALVEGAPGRDSFAVDAPIGPIPHPTLGAVYGASPTGKPSHSDVRVLERRGEASLVEVSITTGRPHQIRIHMAVCGHPLVGDPLFAPAGGLLGGDALPGDTGYLLHAMRLTLPHPVTGTPLEVWCRPPQALRTSGEA